MTTSTTIRLESEEYATLEWAIAEAMRSMFLRARDADGHSVALLSCVASLSGLARVLAWRRPGRPVGSWMGVTPTFDADRHAGVVLEIDPQYVRALDALLSATITYAALEPAPIEDPADEAEVLASRPRIQSTLGRIRKALF